MTRFLRRYRVWVTAVAATLIAIILYWPTLRLPVIYDSLLHIRISDDLTLVTVWLPTDKFGFYRPLTFLPLILIRLLIGEYPGWLLHGLNVFQHGLNAFLLVLLAWRLWHDEWRAFIAGLLFALFPFSYQAVAVYGHNVHPTAVNLILLALHTYLTAIRRQKAHPSSLIPHPPRWWWVTLAIFLLALLNHESAILFGGFAALVHGNERPSSFRLAAIWRQPWLVFLLLGGLYAVAYQFLPISIGPQGSEVSGGGLQLRILYLLQAAAYPFSWLAHLLPHVTPQPLVLGATAVTILLIIFTARRRANWWPLLLGWGWWGAASALIAVPLATSYLLRGPRLLYLSSVGLALAWATMLTSGRRQVASGRQPKVARQGAGNLQSLLSSLLLAFILITNWQFVRGKLAEYKQLTSPLAEVGEVMAQRPSTEGIALVNLPQWLSPPRNTYAVGTEFVAMLGNYLFAEELIDVNLGDHAVYPVVVTDLLEHPAYNYGLHQEVNFRGEAAATVPIPSDWAAGGSQVFIVSYLDDGVQTRHTGGFRPATNGPPIADFGPYALLEADGLFCDGVVEAHLVWRQREQIPPTASIFVQLLDGNGRLIAQADGPPLNLRPDFITVQPGWEITDRRRLTPTEAGTPTEILVGVYDFTTGERFPAYDARQAPLADNAFRLPVQTCP